MGLNHLLSSSSQDVTGTPDKVVGVLSSSSQDKRLGPSRSLSSYDQDTPSARKQKPKYPNPDPLNFVIERSQTNGKFLVVLVHYPDCVNYEGRKVMVYEGVSLKDLVGQGTLDPHFSNNVTYHSPIARFVPTTRGWKMAILLTQALAVRKI